MFNINNFKNIILTLFAAMLFAPGFVSAAALSLSPASGNFNVGDIISAQIILDTQGQPADGVDIRYLNYNSTLLEVQDEDSTQAGIQIAPGSLMSSTAANSVDVSLGKISFSQITSGNATFTGSGVLATARFKALAAGTANAVFDFTLGSTSDTNVASGGVDILTSVAGGSYQLSEFPPPPSAHMLYMNPLSGTFRTGDIISAQIMLDTQSKSIDGVDAVLSYNRTYLDVEDENLTESGIQISGGNLLPSIQRNEVNASTGKIYFSQTTSGNNTFSGAGTLATVRFRAKTVAGNATVNFDFVSGRTSDSNVSFGGVDLLNSVGNASFNIQSNNLPPVILNTEPSGIITLPRSLVLKVETNESASCRYSTTPYTAYDLMTGRFSSVNSIDHSATLTRGFSVGNNYFYVKCRDLSGSISEADTAIFVNIVSDSVYPIISNSNPLGTIFLPGTLTLRVATSEAAYCRYSTSAGVAYDSMTRQFSGSGLDHSISVSASGLRIGENIFYVRCKDQIGNANPSDFVYSFNAVAPPKFIVDLEGQNNMSAASVMVALFLPGSSTEIIAFTARPDSAGAVNLPSNTLLNPGYYDIKVSSQYYLSRKLANINLAGGSAIFSPTLFAGDLNNDGAINSLDWSRMDTDWARTSSPADVNKDRIVNTVDWGYLRKNWLKRGE